MATSVASSATSDGLTTALTSSQGANLSTETPNKLDASTLLKFGIAKVALQSSTPADSADHSKHGITSLNFYSDGLQLVAVSQPDDQIVVFDCESGNQSRLVKSQKYGVELARYTHAPNAILHSSNVSTAAAQSRGPLKENALRYLSLHDNKYIRYFEGHTDRVTALCMSPTDDSFMSASLDQSVRLWDLREPQCLASLVNESSSASAASDGGKASHPVVAFDPDGLIFAVGLESKQIKLYDLRSYDNGPFATFILPAEEAAANDSEIDTRWAEIAFAPDGKHILIVSQRANFVRLIDAFYGQPSPHAFYTGSLVGPRSGRKQLDFIASATFTADSQFLLAGATHSGRIYIWHVESGQKVGILNNSALHADTSAASKVSLSSAIRTLAFNPNYLMLACGSDALHFFLPRLTSVGSADEAGGGTEDDDNGLESHSTKTNGQSDDGEARLRSD